MTTCLACGPYFANDPVLIVSLLVLTVVKPLSYFAFINAYKYRVSTPTPMSTWHAAGLAILRAGLGLVLLILSALLVRTLDQASSPTAVAAGASWSLLVLERVVLWFVIGRQGAVLRGRRLVNWTVGGVSIDLAYDAAVYFGIMVTPAAHLIAAAVIAVFLAITHFAGRRASLTARFGPGVCNHCGYPTAELRSPICPECGHSISIGARADSGPK